jgi:CubicO group peptidase (beta-lactamase class C family)
MKTILLAAAGAALVLSFPLASPASAQTAQERIDERYHRALAAGYKALMLCSAIGNAEALGATRTPESVHAWELTGIQSPLDEIVRELPYEIVRRPSGQIAYVAVTWAEDMPARVASYAGPAAGCSAQPIGALEDGAPEDGVLEDADFRVQPAGERVKRIIEIAQGSHRPSTLLSDQLDDQFSAAFDTSYGEGSRTTAVMVMRGTAAAERYAEGFDGQTPQRTWSVAKSIAATLVGAAAQRGEADINASAGLGESDTDPRRAITIDQALRMASGRYADTPGARTDPLYYGGATVDETAQATALIHAPGTTFRYANNDTLAAVQAIEPTFAAHSPAQLFALLGMTHTVAETDWQGNYILSSQVWTNARDLAILGRLYLNDGKLPDGTRILPEGWVKYVSSPDGPQLEGPFGYGAGFGLMNNSEGVPPDTFAAVGNRGQYVVIVPSRNVVIVRRGEDTVGTRFDIAAFTRDVLVALPE